MRTKFFFLAMLASVAASAQTLNIKITAIDYTKKIATCDISWTGRDATHLSDVWVLVDYVEVSNNAPTGAWKQATITGATVTQNSTGTAAASTVAGNTRGVWIKSTTSGANFTGKIALKLSNIPAKFNACAYATDYPPNAQITSGSYSDGTYTLKGTKPFVINGTTTVNSNTYSAARINSITDTTQCPGYRCSLRDEAVGAIGCCTGLTAIGSYCRDLVADAASAYTCSGVTIEVKNSPGEITSYSAASSACAGISWRLPSAAEQACLIAQGRIQSTGCGSSNSWTGWDWWVMNGTNCRGGGTEAAPTTNCDNCASCSCSKGNAHYFCVRN
jgi:hypothetical protein